MVVEVNTASRPVPVTVYSHKFAGVYSVTFAGHEISGWKDSTTITLTVQVAVLPPASVAVQRKAYSQTHG